MAHKRIDRPLIGITMDSDRDRCTLNRAYPDAIRTAGGLPFLIPPSQSFVEIAEAIDGLLIPGGKDIDPAYFSEKPHPSVEIVSPERTDLEIALLRAVMELRKPVLGICYGMQLINVFLGGSLYQDISSQANTMIDHCRGAHQITGENEMMQGAFMVETSHHQAIKEIAQGLVVLARSGDGIIEAIRAAAYPFLMAVQWHPERSGDDLSRVIFRSFVESARVCK